MELDRNYFEEMEAKIPKGKVRTRFAHLPQDICTWVICEQPFIPG